MIIYIYVIGSDTTACIYLVRFSWLELSVIVDMIVFERIVVDEILYCIIIVGNCYRECDGYLDYFL